MYNKIFLDDTPNLWLQGLPIGNGSIGAMVLNDNFKDTLTLNHENLWRGSLKYRKPKVASHMLDTIREKFLAGDFMGGAQLATKHISSDRYIIMPYQSFADLNIEFDNTSHITNFNRCLDMETAIVTSTTTTKDNVIKRETFASADNKLIAYNIKMQNPLDVKVSINRLLDEECTLEINSIGNKISLKGGFYTDSDPEEFALSLHVDTDGSIVNDNNQIIVKTASYIQIYTFMETNYNKIDPVKWCDAQKVTSSYEEIKKDHIKEYQNYYNRLKLDVDLPDNSNISINKRIENLRNGASDNGLIVTFFNYGRYLFISSARKCDQPVNLQGIWCNELTPPWGSDFHMDINLQMCHWLSDNCGLTECSDALFKFLDRIIPDAKLAARDVYGCNGICLPLATDVWAVASNDSVGWDIWVGSAAWMAQHYWFRWEFTLDKEFLSEKAYPFLRMAADFYSDYLIDTKYGLAPVPSQSPENSFVGGAKPVGLCIGSTSDIYLIKEVLGNTIKAAEILGVDLDMIPKWKEIISKMPKYQVGKYGQLQEWIEDYEEEEVGHRHFSHLIGVFPGSGLLAEDENIIKATEVSLNRRIEGQKEDKGWCPGWNQAWASTLYARLRKGDTSLQTIEDLIKKNVTSSLLDLHPPVANIPNPPPIFQIDGNIGICSTIPEMLVFSHNDMIELLPALPKKWKKGSVKGLRIRGNMELSMSWDDNKLETATIICHSRAGIKIKNNNYGVKFNNKIINIFNDVITLDVSDGDTITLNKGQLMI